MFNEKINTEVNNISLDGVLNPADVLLCVSPTPYIYTPFLGIHSLQASCREVGINTKVFYSNLLYANLIGVNLHQKIASDLLAQMNERIFAFAAFGEPSVSVSRQMHKFLDPNWVPDHIWQVKREGSGSPPPEAVLTFKEWWATVDLENLESLNARWINALAREIVNVGFPIVGCSTTFGGLVPAVALLNSIKKANSKVITILGGTLCEAEMAEGILSLDAGIDYIFSGEGEITFPTFVKQALAGPLPKERIIYGQEVSDLDALLLPDYRDYLQQREVFHPCRSNDKIMYSPGYESSRGCSFGKCTFCSFNGRKNLLRNKSPGKIIRDLKIMVKQHQKRLIIMADTRMPLRYFDTLIPHLSNEIPSLNIEYAVKTNVLLPQVMALKKAGSNKLLLGIESLCNSVLRRLRKGVTVRENIAVLRYIRSCDIKGDWNFLFGVPGDQIREYEEMLHLLPLIRHLPPPHSMHPVLLQRFSKYLQSPEAFDISNIQPSDLYKETLPSHTNLTKIAYFFTADIPSRSHIDITVFNALWREYQVWLKAWAIYEIMPMEILLPNLHITRKSNGLFVLEDTRGLPGRPKLMEIGREQANLLLVARPMEAVGDMGWALDAGLGVIMDSWFIPLATAEPTLLVEFEHEGKHFQSQNKRRKTT